MKKTISIVLITILFITVLLPLSALAGNGPYQSKGENDSEMAIIGFVDIYGDINYVFPTELCKIGKYANSKNINYDAKTNTLTLNNFKTNDIMVVTAMGDDFKIKLSGYNELGCIISSDLSWGSSITITGKGVLYVNEKKNYTDAVFVDGSGTGKAFFKVEKTVGVKLFKGEHNAIGIYGVAEADSKKTIILEGTVNAGGTATYKYVRTIYEQEKVKVVEHYSGAGIFCGKTGAGNENKIFLAEIFDENKDTYNVAEVVFDNELKKYVVLPVSENCKDILLEKNGYVSLAEDKYPKDDVLIIDSYSIDMDVCIDGNGKKCVFVDYSDSGKPESDIEVYEILDHTKYGKLALLYNPKKTYKELKKVKSITEYNHINTSGSITVNSVPKKVPAKVVLKSAFNSFGGVTVSWNATSDTLCYRVYRAQLINNKWSNWSQLSKVTTTNYFDKTAKNGAIYKYTVRAENILGLGAFDSKGISVTYLASPTTTISNTSNGVKVSWNKITGATSYVIYRAEYTNGKWSNWKNMGTQKADKSSWTDNKVNSGVQYRYTVRAIKNKIKSNYKESNEVIYLAMPVVKIANTSKGVSINWAKINGATAYVIYRAEYVNGKWTSWKVVANTGVVTNYTDSTAVSGATYKYTVRAKNNKSLSVYKESTSLLYLAEPAVKIANSSNGIKVSWSKSNGAKSYYVYRAEYANGKWSNWKNMGTQKADKTSWIDKSTKGGAQYRYTVRAINGKVKSTFTGTNGLVRLLTPTVKIVNDIAGVKVSWNKISGATGYIIYRAEYSNGKWTSWVNLGKLSNVNSYIDKTATSGVTYKYTVKACNGNSSGAYKESDKLLYLATPNVSVEKTEKGVTVNWSESKGVKNYIVYRSEYNDTTKNWSSWKALSYSVKPDTLTYSDETTGAGKTYRYAIRAVNGAVKSGYVASASIKI